MDMTDKKREKIIASLNDLYAEIDNNVNNLIHSRLEHDKESEASCIAKMESLMVDTQQQLYLVISHLKGV